MREMAMRGKAPLRVVWTSPEPPGVEVCRVKPVGDGWLIRGTVARRFHRGEGVVDYAIRADSKWETRTVSVREVMVGKESRRELEASGGRWLVDGSPDRALDGCVDVDLEASPVTNTLPLKRRRLRIGEVMDLKVAWVRFPSLEVLPLEQGYQRVGRRAYVYRSRTGFRAELEVDAFGLVKKYGKYWTAV